MAIVVAEYCCLLVNNNFGPIEVKLTSSLSDKIWCKVKLKSRAADFND